MQSDDYLASLPAHPDAYRTGCLKLSPDPRDYDIRSIPRVAAQIKAGIPDAADLTHLIRGPIYNQGAEGACVAFSTAGLCSLDDVTETGQWQTMDAEQMYHAAGGTGQNGVDSRLVLQQATDNGVPILGGGGSAKLLKSYAFVPQQPGLFRDTIKAAIASGLPVTLALLLPSDWGWQSGHGSRTSGYHQVCGIGYTADGYLICLNSWGEQWGHNGVGSILFDYLEADGLQNQYCYSYTVTTLDIPNPTPVPTPTPVPVPTPTPVPPPPLSATVTGRATAGPTNGIWPKVGDGVPFGQDVTLVVETLVYDGTPTPTPIPNPNPTPIPDPTPTPGDLVVTGLEIHGVFLQVNVKGPDGAWVVAEGALTAGPGQFPGRSTIMAGSIQIPMIWSIAGVAAGTTLAVTATDAQGRTGGWTGVK